MAERTHKQITKFSMDLRVPQRWSVVLSTVSLAPGPNPEDRPKARVNHIHCFLLRVKSLPSELQKWKWKVIVKIEVYTWGMGNTMFTSLREATCKAKREVGHYK